jgi:hypothetical protein
MEHPDVIADPAVVRATDITDKLSLLNIISPETQPVDDKSSKS